MSQVIGTNCLVSSSRYRTAVALNGTIFLLCVVLAGCSKPPAPAPLPRVAATGAGGTLVSISPAVDALSDVIAYREQDSTLPSEFEAGHVSPREEELPTVTKTDDGFVIEMPSGTPIATPTVDDGRLYVSGGFSSTEFHCFNAATGAHIWSVDLSDDGPSWAVVEDGVVAFNTESCTVFVLNAMTGEQLWSWYLGDPLLSSPVVVGGRLFTVYPHENFGDYEESTQNMAGGGETDGGETDDGKVAGEEPAEDAIASQQPGSQGAGIGDVMPSEPADASFTSGPTHVLVCFDLQTGAILWQHRVDTDCVTTPVAAADSVFVTTMSGRVYQFRQSDGAVIAAHDLLATTPPVVFGNSMHMSRRIVGEEGEAAVSESIVRCDLDFRPLQELARAWRAPHLDQTIQKNSAMTREAGKFEQMNGIGGGFMGGFGFGGGFGGGSGGGNFQVLDAQPGPTNPDDLESDNPFEPADGGATPATDEWNETEPVDLLARTQGNAALVIGLGNVSTLQCYQGSRPLRWADRCFSCVGDRIVCLHAESGDVVWERQIEGNIEELGGHLGTPPIAAGNWLFVGTVDGKVLRISLVDGAVIQTYEIGSPIRFAPTVMDGRIYVGTQDGKVVCVSAGDPNATGWPTWGGDAAHSNVCHGRAPWQL